MHLDWICPNCNEKHISEIEPIDIGDEVSIQCSDCNVNTIFEVKQKKFFLTYKGNNLQNISKDAIAWESVFVKIVVAFGRLVFGKCIASVKLPRFACCPNYLKRKEIHLSFQIIRL